MNYMHLNRLVFIIFVQENGFHLVSLIKSSGLYRQSRKHDYIGDFLPTTFTELQEADKMMK